METHVQVGLEEGSVGQWYRQQPAYNLALFPNPKKNIIDELTAKFDEEHSESVLAANLESEGAAKIIFQRMSAKVGAVEKERPASRVSTTGVVAKGIAEAEPAFEVDDVVGALLLYQTFMKDEVAACDHDRSMNNIVKKVLINELTLALSSLAFDAVNGHGINLDKIYVTLTKDEADNTCIKDIFQNTNSTDVTRFQFWERVVSASVVANLNRQLVISLGSSHGIDLFLNGRTDMRLGWYVNPLRARKEQVKIDETDDPSKSTSKKKKEIQRKKQGDPC